MTIQEQELPALWALDVAAKRIGYSGWDFVRSMSKSHIGYVATVELARTIAQYEQPPVDPDCLAVRAILTAFYSQGAGARFYRQGAGARNAEDYDSPQFQAALAQFKRELEARK